MLQSTLSLERPLLRWMVRVLTRVVIAETIALVLLSIANAIRVNYLVLTVTEYQLPFADALWWVALLQNILFYGISGLHATVLYMFVWAAAVVNDENERKRNRLAHEELELQRRRFSELERRDREWGG